MILYRPVKSNRINQGFGENKACVDTDIFGNIVRPISVVTAAGFCPVGYSRFYTTIGMKGHNGYDAAAWHGEPVYYNADFKGWMRTEHDQDGGLGVDVVSYEPILQCTEINCWEKHYVKVRFWHGLQVLGWDKKEVLPGDPVMRADSSGASSGDHLHWAPKWCDKNGVGIHSDNGYQGAFNPNRFYDERFIIDVLGRERVQYRTIDLLNQVIFLLRKQVGDILN